jgi:hypothetical protein
LDWRHFRQQGLFTLAIVFATAVILTMLLPLDPGFISIAPCAGVSPYRRDQAPAQLARARRSAGADRRL